MGDDGAAPLPLADASASRAALKSRFRPGLRLLVSYETDPGWHHERVLLSPVIDNDWVVLTPDDDVYSESLSDWKSVEVLTGLDTYPASVVRGVVQFGEPLGDEELLRFVASARETAVQERALRPGRIYPADCSVALSWDGGALAIPPPAWHARVRGLSSSRRHLVVSRPRPRFRRP